MPPLLLRLVAVRMTLAKNAVLRETDRVAHRRWFAV